MSKLLLALVLAASTDALAHDGPDDERDARGRRSCSVDVSVVDAHGRLRDARRVSASTVPSVVIEGTIARRGRDEDEEAPKLLFDVYNPRGRRYQVLLATPRVRATEHHGQRIEQADARHARRRSQWPGPRSRSRRCTGSGASSRGSRATAERAEGPSTSRSGPDGPNNSQRRPGLAIGGFEHPPNPPLVPAASGSGACRDPTPARPRGYRPRAGPGSARPGSRVPCGRSGR